MTREFSDNFKKGGGIINHFNNRSGVRPGAPATYGRAGAIRFCTEKVSQVSSVFSSLCFCDKLPTNPPKCLKPSIHEGLQAKSIRIWVCGDWVVD
jgi:hypothetical protein